MKIPFKEPQERSCDVRCCFSSLDVFSFHANFMDHSTTLLLSTGCSDQGRPTQVLIFMLDTFD